MSDEYANSGYKGSLANSTVGDQSVGEGNYPSEHDTTSSGGYGSSKNIYSNKSQRGRDDISEAGTFTSSRGEFDRNSGASSGESQGLVTGQSPTQTQTQTVDVNTNLAREGPQGIGIGIGIGPGSNEIQELPKEVYEVRNEDGSFGVPVDR